MLNSYVPFEETDLPRLDEGAKDELVRNAVQEWMDYHTLLQQKYDQSTENWQAYLQNRPAGAAGHQDMNAPSDTHASVRTGVLSATLDGMHAQLCLSAYPSGTSFSEPKPRNKAAGKFKQEYERLTQLSAQKLNLAINANQDIKQLLLDGTAACWHPFVRVEKKRPFYTMAGGMLGQDDDLDDFSELLGDGVNKAYREVVEVEGTGFYPILFEDWKADPTVDDINKTAFLWRRWVHSEDLEDCESFENLDDIVPYKDLVQDSNRLQKLQYQGINGPVEYSSHMMGAGDDPNNYPDYMVCVIERWGDFYIDGKFYENHVLIFSNDRTFHYFGPNPYDHGEKPFSISPFIPVPGSLFGKTSITDAVPLMHAMDTMLNQSLDILSVNANSPFQYDINDIALKEYINSGRKIYPGALIPKSTGSSGLEAVVADMRGLSMIDSVFGRIQELMSNTTGGVPYATGGVTSEQDRTLGEVEILAAGTSARFQTVLQTYEKYRLQPYVLQEFENFRQYMSEPVEIDEEGRQLMPQVVKMMDFDFEITGSRTVLNKSKSLQDIREALALFPQVAQAGIATLKPSTKQLNAMPLIEEALKTLGVNIEQVVEEVEQNTTLGGANEIDGIPQAAAGQPNANMEGLPADGGLPNSMPTVFG